MMIDSDDRILQFPAGAGELRIGRHKDTEAGPFRLLQDAGAERPAKESRFPSRRIRTGRNEEKTGKMPDEKGRYWN